METITDLREFGGADAFMAKCPSRKVLDVLANKWTLLVVAALRDGSMRFGELRRRLDGITQKMLSQTLRTLERNGLVTRTVSPTIPPKVEYELTELGTSVSRLLDAIRAWSEDHLADILTAQEEYDRRASQEPAPVR